MAETAHPLGPPRPLPPATARSAPVIAPPPAAAPVQPAVGPAPLRPRHRGLMLSVVALVIAPILLAAAYLYLLAEDRFASTAGFTIRQEETGLASDLLGGLGNLVGARGTGSSDLLFEFLRSQDLVERVQARLDLFDHFSATWGRDPVFSLWPEATIEDLTWFWNRVVRVVFDRSTGLIVLQVRARDPETARRIATLIVEESEDMINRLNETARRDTTRIAEADLAAALDRLRAAREAMAGFRLRTRIVDPQADIQGRLGVLTTLQQQLAAALVEQDLLPASVEGGDPRLRQAQRRIEVIRARILEERRGFIQREDEPDHVDFPSLIAQFEGLAVDQAFAERTYQAALTALDTARSNAARQSLYLGLFIRPTLAQRAEHPQRLLLTGLTALFATLIWAAMSMVYYSLRDRG